MSKGKRAKKKEKSIGKIFLFLVFVIMIVLVVILVQKMLNTKPKIEGDNISSTNTGNEPIISYYDEKEKINVPIEDNKVLNKYVRIAYSKGNAKISKNGADYVSYDDEVMQDGTYTFVVEADDGTVSKRTFVIDTKAPVVIGVENDIYNTERTIKLEDPSDAKSVMIKKDNEEIVDLKNVLTKKESSYTVRENGNYALYVEDYNENGLTIRFSIEIK